MRASLAQREPEKESYRVSTRVDRYVNVSHARAGTAFYFKVRPATSPPVTSYSLSISLRSLLATVRKTTRPR